MLQKGIITLKVDLNGYITVIKNNKVLKQRINSRNRMEKGDPRVDICFEKRKLSINISHLVWMHRCNQTIPIDFEMHHIDENPLNNLFCNLLCIHKIDHHKLHKIEIEEEIPF